MNSTTSDRQQARWLIFTAVPIILLSLVVNLETIRTFPSWFDEAFMANIAFNLSQGQGRILDISPGYTTGEINLYGPVYFWLQAHLIQWFGLQDWIFRLPNLLSAYCGILLMALILRHNQIGRPWWMLFVLLAIVDVSFNRNLVSGRMDMLAVLLVLCALLLASISPVKGWMEKIRWVSIGGFSAIAYLTTPRALFLLPVVAIVGIASIFHINRQQVTLKAFSPLVFGLIAFTAPILLWIITVGGIDAYIALFTGSETVQDHIAPSFFRSSYDNVAIGAMLVLSLLHIRHIVHNTLIVGLLLTYLAFSLFVNEVGPYAGMIMPFVLATTVAILCISEWRFAIKITLVLLLIFPGLILIALRGGDLIINAGCRDNAHVLATIQPVVGDNANIIAPFKYYFFLEGSGKKLTTFEYARMDRQSMLNQADVVLSTSDQDQDLISRGFRPVAKISCAPQKLPLLPNTFLTRSTFNEIIFHR